MNNKRLAVIMLGVIAVHAGALVWRIKRNTFGRFEGSESCLCVDACDLAGDQCPVYALLGLSAAMFP